MKNDINMQIAKQLFVLLRAMFVFFAIVCSITAAVIILLRFVNGTEEITIGQTLTFLIGGIIGYFIADVRNEL